MRYGIVSDIHANIQAWKAVLRDMRKNGVDSILCLGDVIGYGPNPAEVLDSCYEHCDHFILGNHDAVIGNRLDSSLFNDNARHLIEWTRDQLNPAATDFFSNMPLRMEGDGFVCAHGELALPGRFGYIYEAQDAIESFTSTTSPLMFIGHTHFPAKFTFDLNSNHVTKDPCLDFTLRQDQRYMINAGSVGDPRDGQTTASYCIYDADEQRVIYRQVPFDVDGFRRNLQKVQLPVNPFFLRVLDGQSSETETIRDMEAVSAQAKDTPVATAKITQVPAELKKSRQKLTFSTDNIRQTRQLKSQEGLRKSVEAESKKKSTKLIAMIGTIFVLALIIGIVLVRQKMETPKVATTPVVENIEVEKEPEQPILSPKDGDDLRLSIFAAKYPDELEFDDETGLLMGWTSLDQYISWKARLSKSGFYEVIVKHMKPEGDCELKATFGTQSVSKQLEKSAEIQETSLGFIELSRSTSSNFSLKCVRKLDGAVTALESVFLKYHGKTKPRTKVILDDVVFENFESPLYRTGWFTRGNAFGYKTLSQDTLFSEVKVSGVEGNHFAGSLHRDFKSRDESLRAQGFLFSPPFKVTHEYVNFLVRAPGDFTSRVLLVEDGAAIQKQNLPKGNNNALVPFHWDIKAHLGKTVQLAFEDKSPKAVLIDRIMFTDKIENDFQPGTTSLQGKKFKVVEAKSNIHLQTAALKMIEGDFEGALTSITTAAELTGADMSQYKTALESVKDFEAKVLLSYKQDIGKVITFVSRSANKEFKVIVVDATDKVLKVRLKKGANPTPLNFNILSETEIAKRVALIPNGKIAQAIYEKKAQGLLNELASEDEDMNFLLEQAKSSTSSNNLKENVLKAQKIELWLESPKKISNLKIRAKTLKRSITVDPEIVSITDLYSTFYNDDYKKSTPFKVAVFDLKQEVNLDSFEIIKGNGDLKTVTIIIRDSSGNITWQRSQLTSTSSILKKLPKKYSLDEIYKMPKGENLAFGKGFTESSAKSESWFGLTDGIWANRKPFGFATNGAANFPKNVVVDLGEEMEINAIRLGTPIIGSTREIEVSVSIDGKEFTKVNKFYRPLEREYKYTLFLDTQKVRYVRVRFLENHRSTHQHKNPNNAFLSELEVYKFE
ncbi:MAG: metallophosphoesterase family protein [Lentisphaeraceae bacterium]|nr:metallophosphoesterase family protein [Lentisphaeraceae bacterium]